jgi:type I site-specific restriction endonuclease
MNEEEIRGKLLLPFLNDLGFNLSEISLEKPFSIRLGKSKHTIKGRSDILCKRNGKNLFIIELKNDSISIDQQDIEQGISYARLLTGNIAPFTIITNGKTTRIFDSISREELTGKKISKQSTYWQNECTLSTDIDLRIRYEACFSTESFRESKDMH